jgi:hypothetical protein
MRAVRTRVAWPLLLPALIVAEHGGHVLVHRLQEPNANSRAELLAHTGHGYMGYLQALVGVCAVLVGAALVACVRAGFRRRPLAALPAWWWAGLPALAFLFQESVGRLIHTGGAEWSTLFALGAALELACGVLCVLLVRRLLVAAHSVGRALADAIAARPRLALLAVPLSGPQLWQPPLIALARGSGERAPPRFG